TAPSFSSSSPSPTASAWTSWRAWGARAERRPVGECGDLPTTTWRMDDAEPCTPARYRPRRALRRGGGLALVDRFRPPHRRPGRGGRRLRGTHVRGESDPG